MIGTFVILQSVGSAVAALVGGMLVDKVGSWAAIRAASLVEVLALAAVTVAGIAPAPAGIAPAMALPLYVVAFLCMGFVNGTSWWSFSTYLLDITSEARRPLYLATSGILVSVTALNPVIAGALFEAVMPEVIFAGSGLLALVGLGLAWTLRGGFHHRERA